MNNFFQELDDCNGHDPNNEIKLSFPLSVLSVRSVWTQIISAFIFSIILAPISKGIIYIILSIIAFEVILAFVYRLKICLFTRFGIACAAILGFIIGRLIYKPDDDPFGQLHTWDLEEEWKSLPIYSWFTGNNDES